MDLKAMSKKELKDLNRSIESELKTRSYEIGDYITIELYYNVGSSDAGIEFDTNLKIYNQNELDAVKILEHILTNETSPNKGSWGFMMNRTEFSKRENKAPYYLLYSDKDELDEEDLEAYPTEYNGIQINDEIVSVLEGFVDELFFDEGGNGFLVFNSFDISY